MNTHYRYGKFLVIKLSTAVVTLGIKLRIPECKTQKLLKITQRLKVLKMRRSTAITTKF